MQTARKEKGAVGHVGDGKQRGIGKLLTDQAQHPFLVLGAQGIEGLLQEYPL